MHGPQNIKFMSNKFIDLFLVYLIYIYNSIFSIAKSMILRCVASCLAKTVGGGERERGMQVEFPP